MTAEVVAGQRLVTGWVGDKDRLIVGVVGGRHDVPERISDSCLVATRVIAVAGGARGNGRAGTRTQGRGSLLAIGVVLRDRRVIPRVRGGKVPEGGGHARLFAVTIVGERDLRDFGAIAVRRRF